MKWLLALLIFASPALAGGWERYVNERFGASAEIPPGFVNDGPPPENGDGLTWHDAKRDAELKVWGGNLAAWDFAEDFAQTVTSEQEQGFDISYRTSANLDMKASGPSWFAYSGTGKGRIVYGKALASCGGEQEVAFRIEYPEARKAEFDAVVARLAKSLKAMPVEGCEG